MFEALGKYLLYVLSSLLRTHFPNSLLSVLNPCVCQMRLSTHLPLDTKPPIAPLASHPHEGDSLNLFQYFLLLIVFLLCCWASNSVLLPQTVNPIMGSYETLPEDILLYCRSLWIWCPVFFPLLRLTEMTGYQIPSGITGRTVTLLKRGCTLLWWEERSGIERIWAQAPRGIR